MASLRRKILVISEQKSENFKLYFAAVKAQTDNIGVDTLVMCGQRENRNIRYFFQVIQFTKHRSFYC